MGALEISTDKTQLDLHFINGFISNSYWAKDRTIEMMQICIDNSLNFGIYLDNKQIGYARVVTDYAQFAYVMDVFIDPEYQRKGYSKKLMSYLIDCEELKNVNV